MGPAFNILRLYLEIKWILELKMIMDACLVQDVAVVKSYSPAEQLFYVWTS